MLPPLLKEAEVVRIRTSKEGAVSARAYENEADVLMDEMPDMAPLDLAREIMAKRGVFNMDAEAIPHVAEVLRGRQSAWLKEQHWQVESATLGRQELQRSTKYAQAAAPDDINEGVLTRET